MEGHMREENKLWVRRPREMHLYGLAFKSKALDYLHTSINIEWSVQTRYSPDSIRNFFGFRPTWRVT